MNDFGLWAQFSLPTPPIAVLRKRPLKSKETHERGGLRRFQDIRVGTARAAVFRRIL